MIGWWEEYEILWRMCEMGNEYGSVHSWKEKIRTMRIKKGWEVELKQQEDIEVE